MKLYFVETRKASVEWSGYATPKEINKMMEDAENAFYNPSYKTAVFDSLEKAQKYVNSNLQKSLHTIGYNHDHAIRYEVISIEEVEKEEYDADPILCNRNMIDYFIPDFIQED